MAKEIKESINKDRISLDLFYQSALDIERNRVDITVKDIAKNLWVADDGTLSFQYETPDGPDVENMTMSSWAMAQLSTKLGMPATYAEKCINRGHADLAATNFNTWITEQNGNKRRKTTDYLIRTYNGNVEGILSSNYTAFDTTKILDVVKKAMDVEKYTIVGSYLSNDRMHLRMINDERMNVDGENLRHGIFIDSSDMGRTAFNISFGIWDATHGTGLCIKKVDGNIYHQRHMGISSLEVETEMVKRYKSVPDLIAKSEAIIKAAKTENVDLNNAKVFEKMLSDICRLSKMTEEQATKVLELAKTSYAPTRWGVVGAMTALAQQFELDDRIRIENAAGQLISI